MAAYLAGRRGRRRDAVLVGATVTLTHTVGVLVLGLLLTVASSVAGEAVLRYLGVVSGLLVVVVGVVLLRDARRDLREHSQDDALRRSRSGAPSGRGPVRRPAGAPAGRRPGTRHAHDDAGRPRATATDTVTATPTVTATAPRGFSRRSLVGIGVAGGLVPSPSALVVLLGAIALGRTVFGVLLVLAYGLGMAGVLTAVGLLLVHGRARLERLAPGRGAGSRTPG